MKATCYHYYLIFKIITLIIILNTNLLYAQCESATNNSASEIGPYTTDILTEYDGIRNGPNYSGGTLFYPENATAPFASIVIVPGFATLESSIQSWGTFLASHGIVTMTIGTNSIFDQPEDRKDALLDAIETIKQENTRDNSPLFNLIDINRFAVAGWSMGGGGAQLAAVEDSSLMAVVAMCPWLNTLTLTPSDLNHNTPVLIVSGQIDVISPPMAHADVHYNYTPESTDKLIYEVGFSSHLVANSPEGGNGDVGRMVLSWLKRYLIYDECYCPLLEDEPSNASSFINNIECEELKSQTIDFNLGWSFVSTYIASENRIFSDIVSPISESIIIAKNNLGEAYFPNLNYNGIGNWQDGQGYCIKMLSNETLTIEGTQLIPEENSILLSQGWNMIAFLPTESKSADEVFHELIENNILIIAKDHTGSAFLPEWSFNAIGNLEAGKGYVLKVNSTSILNF